MDEVLKRLMAALAAGDATSVRALLAAKPALATVALERDGGRASPAPQTLQRLGCYFYAGDTALHVAAAAHTTALTRLLLDAGADARAANRRGTTPLHFAAAGAPEDKAYDPAAQVAAISMLVEAGADLEARNKDGATPLHRAIRSRCSASVRALIELGASPTRPNRRGSSPMSLATHATGRGGAGGPIAKSEQVKIVQLLVEAGAAL